MNSTHGRLPRTEILSICLTCGMYKAIVLDYDGTLFAMQVNVLVLFPPRSAGELSRLLRAGVIIGVATGRGQSAREGNTRSQLDQRLWERVVVGHCNGGDIGDPNGG